MISTVVLGVCTLGPSLAFAADNALTSIHITANIPNKQFHVQPRDPNFGKDEVMHYNPVSKKLTPLRQTFDVKNTDGSVHAYIDGSTWLYNGAYAPIYTVVFFNNVFLTNVPQEVVDDETSTPGTQAEMHIYSPLPLNFHQVGLYTGDITVVFDAVPRVTL